MKSETHRHTSFPNTSWIVIWCDLRLHLVWRLSALIGGQEIWFPILRPPLNCHADWFLPTVDTVFVWYSHMKIQVFRINCLLSFGALGIIADVHMLLTQRLSVFLSKPSSSHSVGRSYILMFGSVSYFARKKMEAKCSITQNQLSKLLPNERTGGVILTVEATMSLRAILSSSRIFCFLSLPLFNKPLWHFTISCYELNCSEIIMVRWKK